MGPSETRTWIVGYILASTLIQQFLNYINIPKENFSEKKFGILMTTLINRSENVFNIQRKSIRSGITYNGIKFIK